MKSQEFIDVRQKQEYKEEYREDSRDDRFASYGGLCGAGSLFFRVVLNTDHYSTSYTGAV